jgi:hypothetical protein
MTWRAFLIGILGVVVLCLVVPVNDYKLGNTFLTGNHFPVGVFFALVFLTLAVNGVLRLVRRAWMLRQPELMLVWCMMIVASTVPASGLMRNFVPAMTAAPYLSQRPDLIWDDVLREAPEGILLSNRANDTASKKFWEGTPKGEPVRVPWGQWTRVFLTWGIYIGFFYLATLFMSALLRKQWVESERLFFVTARVPLDFTEGAGEGRLLPDLIRGKAFLAGALVTVVFGVIRIAPLFTGGTPTCPLIPFPTIFEDTPLGYVGIYYGKFYPIAIGFAFLVPSDVSLSIWFFYLFMLVQIIIANELGRPLEGGRSGPFLQWQQSGAFLALAAGVLYMARQHLWAVLKSAFPWSRRMDDAGEPVSCRLSFWGLVISVVGLVVWNVHFKLGVAASIGMVGLTFAIVLVHSRMVAQGGLFFTQQSWGPSWFLHRISGGQIFSAPAAVVASLQGSFLISDSREVLGPHAMNALRIWSVFRKRRRLFLPIMLVTLAAGLAAAGYSTLRWVYYDQGVLNVPIGSSHLYHLVNLYNEVHTMISQPWQGAQADYGALATGVGGMALLMALRGRFYWWPINALGFAIAMSWCTRELWFSFFLGWLAKTVILKFGAGQTLRGGRQFFLGVIVAEAMFITLLTVFSMLTGTRTYPIFLPY